MAGRLRHGTSSWSEKSWVGPFYPPGTPPGEFLTWYATQFDTVEVDATYYSVPSRPMAEGWERKVPEGFTLSGKFPRSVVHCGAGPRPDASKLLVEEHVGAERDLFLERMACLGPKVGPLVLQFPYFNRGAFAERGPFLERLAGFLETLPPDFRYAVEIRNKGWVDEGLLELLRARNVALVWVELAYMPHPASLAKRLDLVTADFVYARLIGDRKLVEARTETFDHIVVDMEASLGRWAGLLQQTLQRVPEAYVYANNHYAGHGPATIRALAEKVAAG